MSIFRSQFESVRPFTQAYAGSSGDPSWRTPAAAAAVVAAGGAVAVLAASALAGEVLAGDDDGAGGAAADAGGWGEGWDAGWDTGTGAGAAGPTDHSGADGGPWLDRGDYTDAGVGGDDGFFYFIDGDSSMTTG